MAKKRTIGNSRSGMIPNISLSRAARAGEKTEDELLLERKKPHKPVPLVPAQAEFTRGDPWRVLRIMGEFVHAFDALAEVGAAITIFGSARTPESDPQTRGIASLTREGHRLANEPPACCRRSTLPCGVR